MSKLGIQWQRETDAVLAYNRLVLPRVLKSINCHSREFWQQLVNDNPNSIRIYRHYPNYDDWRDEPEQCAVNAVHTIMAEIAHIQDLITHIEDNNEWVFPFFSNAEIDAADRYMETFIKTAWDGYGMRVVFLNSACGNWGDDIIVFYRTLQAAEQYGAVLGQHEYDYPTMDRIYKESGNYWLCGKWQKSMAAIKATGYIGIKCIITETGIDGGVADKPMKGWRSVPNSLENYAASLLWYNDLLNDDEDMLGASIFIMSGEGMWSDFDIEESEVPARIAQFPKPKPPDPEPPNGDSMVKIYDFNNNPFDPGATTRDWAWLHSIFGPDLRIHSIEEKEDVTLTPGDIIYKVVYLDCKVGETSVVIHVEDTGGNPEQGKLPVFGWPSAEEHGLPENWKLWTKNGVFGLTNENGDVGPSMGTGAYYDWTKIDPETGKPEHGPHFVYVWDLPSDMVTGIGMLPWHPDVEGNHLHVNVGYRAEVYGGEPPIPPTPPAPPNGEVIAALNRIGDALVGILAWLTGETPPPPGPPEDTVFRGEYFNNIALDDTPVLVRDDEKIDFEWGGGSPEPGVVNADDFSVRWTGKRTFESRPYTFRALTDDGFRLWVDDELLIDAWKLQGPTPYEAVKTMAAGQHNIKVEFYERGGGAVCKLRWE